MSPVAHLLVGWVVANTANLNRRERAAVTVAGAAADLDGLGVIAEIFTRESDHSLPWFSDYHHVLGHNLAFGLVVVGTSALVATRRWKTAGLALLTFHPDCRSACDHLCAGAEARLLAAGDGLALSGRCLY
jgi:inner membrane protein